MSSDKRSGTRAPVMLRIKLRYPDVDTFIGKFATNVSRGGMFIASRKPKPVGSKIRFELQLADGSLVIGGEGVVRWVREFDENKPRQPHGMGIEFGRLSDESSPAIDRIVELRERRGLDTDAIPMAEKEPEAQQDRPKKRAKRRTKGPEGKKKKRRARRTTKAPAGEKSDEQPPGEAPPDETPSQEIAAAPEPEAAPESKGSGAFEKPDAESKAPDPFDSLPSGVPVHIDLADTDRQLAAILETDNAGIAAMILRAREIAYEAGGDGDIDALLRVHNAPVAASVADASAALSGIVGAPQLAPRPRRAIEPGAEVAAEIDTLVGVDPEALIEPVPEDDDPITMDEPIGLSNALDELAHGTPPPPPDTPESPDIEPMLEPRGGGDSTVVESSVPESGPIDFSAEATPLPPPISDEEQEAALGNFTPPPNPADDELSQELAVDAMDVDDLIASGLDELPSGQVPAIATADEFSEAPTNVVTTPDDELAADGEIPTDVVDRDDEEINAALEALLGDQSTVSNSTQDVTAVRDETGQSTMPVDEDGIEIDLDEDTGVGEEPDDDPDSDDKKKGFFKRMFRKK